MAIGVRACCGLIGVVIFVATCAAQAVPSLKFGDSWHVSIQHFPKETSKDGKLFATKAILYDMHVVVLGTEKIDGANCWRIELVIPEKIPVAGLPARQRIFVDAEDGWLRKVFNFRDGRSLYPDSFEKGRMTTSGAEGYPVEFLPRVDSFEAKSSKSPYTLTYTNAADTGKRTAILRVGDEKKLEIRQVWKEGENWWREYERYRDGRLELKATLVEKKTPTPAPKTEPKDKPPQPAPKKEPSAPPLNQNSDALARDPRLQSRVSLNLQNPTIQDLLNPMSTVSGVKLTADENVEASKPIFGTIAWGNYPVHMAMGQVAESPVIHGRWVKTDDGYRLLGWPKSKEPTPNEMALMKVLLAIFGGVSIILSAVVVVLWRRKRAPNT